MSDDDSGKIGRYVEGPTVNAVLAVLWADGPVIVPEHTTTILWCEQHLSVADVLPGDCHWVKWQMARPGDLAPALCVVTQRTLLLSADGPVIVVDGKMIGFDDAAEEAMNTRLANGEQSLMTMHVAMNVFLDAAREVAEREEQ